MQRNENFWVQINRKNNEYLHQKLNKLKDNYNASDAIQGMTEQICYKCTTVCGLISVGLYRWNRPFHARWHFLLIITEQEFC